MYLPNLYSAVFAKGYDEARGGWAIATIPDRWCVRVRLLGAASHPRVSHEKVVYA